MKYQITIKELVPYAKTKQVYEGEDDKRYVSTYNFPEGLKYVTKNVPTGETGFSENTVYTQEKENLDLVEVIKAINNI